MKAQIWTHRVEIILYSDFLAFYVKTLIITIFGGRSVNIKLIWVQTRLVARQSVKSHSIREDLNLVNQKKKKETSMTYTNMWNYNYLADLPRCLVLFQGNTLKNTYVKNNQEDLNPSHVKIYKMFYPN